MKIYILEDVDQVSDRYHSDGGVVIIAHDLDHAKELVDKTDHLDIKDAEWEKAIAYELSGENIQPEIFIFPNAGCCP